MILNVDILKKNKILGKGRETAAELLATLVKALNLPQPNYCYEVKPLPGKQTKTEKGGDNNSKKFFHCEVSARIPTPIYQQKFLHEMRQQQKKWLNGVPPLPTKHKPPHHVVANGKSNHATSDGVIGTQPLQLPINGSDSDTNSSSCTMIRTKAGEHIMVPITFPKPEQLKNGETYNIFGAGECDSRSTARNLAALEVIYQMEQILNVPRGGLSEHLQLNAKTLLDMTELESHHFVPYHEEIPGITWQNIPTDSSFAAFRKPSRTFVPATRVGNIDFMPQIMKDEHALIAAKAITLASVRCLPTVDVHANVMKEGSMQRYANVQNRGGPLEGVVGTLPGGEMNIGLDSIDAIVLSLISLYNKMTHEPAQKDMKKVVRERYRTMITEILKEKATSYGMAKLFVNLPKHQFEDLSKLIGTIPIYSLPQSYSNVARRRPPQRRFLRSRSSNNHSSKNNESIDRDRQERIATFRQHQKLHPLPVDSIEGDIPHTVSVTIVRGGTGSGKTTRYPLMLNLFSPEPSHIIVAQPRRLACQTAARRVAQEQGYTLGKSNNCPIGYAVRFESVQPSYDCDRTIQFQTPGVLLRRAAEDPLLSDVTHLCIDEIHERNADIDLLLALAKQAVRRRLNHKELPPLKLILMSATLDSSHWESYFRGNGVNSEEVSVAVVNVPEIRRFPITTVHLDDSKFPLERYHTQDLIRKRGQYDEDSEDDICRVTALLALRLYQKSMDGSILCFLPGMEEIRRVHRYIDYRFKGQVLPTVVYLHSSVSSTDQALAFEPGAKIILSTNIAETSVTIPDCKYVIDSGRERQFSLLGSSASSETDDSEASDAVSVVGSQLVSVDISQASAKQRAGRAGRVSAGTCYRLYTKNMFDYELPEFTTPEMLRMELSQLVLHSISLYHPASGDHPLSLLSGAPDPPAELKLRQTLRGLVSQGLVDIDDDQNVLESFAPTDKRENFASDARNEHAIRLTPLGRAVSEFPVEPRVGRMLFLGLALQAIDPSLTIAALLSVPKVFSPSNSGKDETKGITTCSDIIVQMEAYNSYRNGFRRDRNHPKAVVFDQVTRIRGQLERAMTGYLRRSTRTRQLEGVEAQNEINWNLNSHRVAAQAALICSATPHVAHLVHAKEDFATRDVAGTAKIHPTSVNHRTARRAYWYVYHELRQAKAPYLYTTTAVSPLELALFADADSLLRTGPKDQSGGLYEHIRKVFGDDSWMFHADHWVPVVALEPSQKEAIQRLRQMLMYDMLQQVALDPISFAKNEKYMDVVLYVLSALEQQRLPTKNDRLLRL